MKKFAVLLATAAAITLPSAADAALVFNVNQVGSNVVVSGSGSINTAALTPVEAANFSIVINAAQGAVFTGPQTSTRVYENAITNPRSFGTNNTFNYASTGTGDTFGLYANQTDIFLPLDYVSGTNLVGTATYTGKTFASLGLNTGTYLFNLRGGDTVTVNIGSAVPEPATWAMMMLGFGGMGFAMRRRQKVTTRVRFA